MRLSPDHIKGLPKTTAVLQSLPQRIKGTQIEKAYFAACAAEGPTKKIPVPQKLVRDSLKFGFGPDVTLRYGTLRAYNGGGTVVDACGSHDNDLYGPYHFIVTTSYWIDAVEFGIGAEFEKNVSRLLRTLLHEAVHWVREEAGAENDIRTNPTSIQLSTMEAGQYFEMLAYGDSAHCSPDNLFDALASISPSGWRKLVELRKSGLL